MLTPWQTIKKYPLASAIDTIYLVEASAHLRNVQKNLLCGPDVRLTETEVGWEGICKHTNTPIVWTETIQSVPKRRTVPNPSVPARH